MSFGSSAPAMAVLRICVHLLIAGLLALAVARAVAGLSPHPEVISAVALLVGAVYAVGPALERAGASHAAIVIWLVALEAVWLTLLTATADGVWLAFPLYFLQLHLLPRRWGLAAVAVTTAAAIAGFSWHQHAVDIGTVIGPVLGAAFATATVLGYQELSRESEQRRALIDELTATRADLAASEHAAGVLAERERLAREIHDTVTQGLSSIQLLLRAAEQALPDRPGAARDHVSLARQSAQDNLAEARRLVRELTPLGLEGQSLAAALARLCATSTAASDLLVRFHLSGVPVELPTQIEVALLRIAQSALANTVQHARATRSEVTLSYMDAQVTLDVVDNGAGFLPAELPVPGTGSGSGSDSGSGSASSSGGFGLAGIRARTRSLGGTLSIESQPGHGTALAVSFPMPGLPEGIATPGDHRAAR